MFSISKATRVQDLRTIVNGHEKNQTQVGTCLAQRLLGPSVSDRLALLNQYQSDPVLQRRKNADIKWEKAHYRPHTQQVMENFRVENFSNHHRTKNNAKLITKQLVKSGEVLDMNIYNSRNVAADEVCL